MSNYAQRTAQGVIRIRGVESHSHSRSDVQEKNICSGYQYKSSESLVCLRSSTLSTTMSPKSNFSKTPMIERLRRAKKQSNTSSNHTVRIPCPTSAATTLLPPLPTEIWLKILSHITHHRTLRGCALVNRMLYKIISGKEFDGTLFRLPATLNSTEDATPLFDKTAMHEGDFKAHPFLINLHFYSRWSRKFTSKNIWVRDVGCKKSIRFKESLVAKRSATFPPTSHLIVSRSEPDLSRIQKGNSIHLQRSSGVTVLDVIEAFATLDEKRPLLTVRLSESALKDKDGAQMVLYGRYG